MKILVLFFEAPYEEFHLRKIAKLANVSSSTAKRFLDFYEEIQFLIKSRKANLALFKANAENVAFRQMKLGYFLIRTRSLTDFLNEMYPNSSIVLDGSCARGEDDKDSDIDFLVISKKTEKVDLTGFERKLGRKITLIVYTPVNGKKKLRKIRRFTKEL